MTDTVNHTTEGKGIAVTELSVDSFTSPDVRAVQLPLGRSIFALVDPDDYAVLRQYRWYACPANNGSYYARRSAYPGVVYMHKQILGFSNKEDGCGDHINGNTLDNRKANLRHATKSQNSTNRRARGESGYKGVYWNGHSFHAYIRPNGTTINLGNFGTAEDAARAYDFYARQHHGEFAWLNFPSDDSKLPRRNPTRLRSLADWQIRAMRRAREEVQLSYAQLGKAFGVSEDRARKVCLRIVYKDVQ